MPKSRRPVTHAHRSHADRGFTLIEIMVVIVILGVLAALVVPSVLSRTDDARIVAAKSDLAAIRHNLGVVRHICDRVAVMYAGRIVETAPTEELFSDPKHPYTRGLLAAVPHPDPDVPMQAMLGGEPADPARLPTGCAFHPRCSECFERCRVERPELREVRAGRLAACHLYNPLEEHPQTSLGAAPVK